MEAHIIVHAIKEVQMLSGSAHIVISQCNTSLIFVFNFSHCLPPTIVRRRAGLDAVQDRKWQRDESSWLQADVSCSAFKLEAHPHKSLNSTPTGKKWNISEEHKVDLGTSVACLKLPRLFKGQMAESVVWSIQRRGQELQHPSVTFYCSGPCWVCCGLRLSQSVDHL